MIDFKFKPFHEMTADDYQSIGFKSGLEIHQQVLTDKKLFCRCPAGRYDKHYDAEILRHMRPTLSELGEYDGTALMEFKTKKEIIYRIHRETVCTYEMDDTPPFELNQEALDIALIIGMLYRCSMIDEIHIARKQYLDGSIPTGFQRTTIVGVDGSIPYNTREIRIVQLGLEEDACREVEDIGHRRVYLTDRLGMPLIETVTAPEMKTPQEVAEVGEILRRLVRSTLKVRTGLGAARQDVNVSVDGGTRIEIKGVPKISRIPLLTYNEAMRQWNLLRLRDELHRRNITSETFGSRTETVTKLLKKTQYQPIKNAISEGYTVKAVVLNGYAGLLRWQTQTDTYFSKEISDRIRVIACLTNLPNLIHSDSPSETIAASDWKTIKKTMNASDDDVIVIVWGNSLDAETAAREIAIRAREAAVGIPSETRQALRDGTNGFERILPGPDRMYPDTDLPPIRVDNKRLERLRFHVPEHFWDREKRYRELQIPEDTIRPLAISEFAVLFDELVSPMKIDPVFASVVLIQIMKRLKKRFASNGSVTPHVIKHIFQAYASNRIKKSGVIAAMERGFRQSSFSDEMLPSCCSNREIEETVDGAVKSIDQGNFKTAGQYVRFLMGVVMRKLKGRVDGALIWHKVKELPFEVRS